MLYFRTGKLKQYCWDIWRKKYEILDNPWEISWKGYDYYLAHRK